MSYRFHFCKTFSISRSSSRQILHAAISFPIFLSVSGSHSSSQGLYEEPESDLIISTFTEREEREEAREWSAKRDEIAQTMWTDYMARNIR
ncbi:uncharacterized protein [Gossypium hirsutum]|uniref:Uncharacterized protein isoform X2 n=1 Tax=Gossypium hirsutum TaxID=3635 RepID=A0ABM2YK44_GOSHI|nr:uncharacterized protein LOC107927344 isoform X2 [Gossypium hirsutum]